MVSRDRWLAVGASVLREEGIAGVRIDRLAARLGVTKGSFHHHFAGVADFHRALLEQYETAAIERIQAAVALLGQVPPRQILMQATAQAASDSSLDSAMRGWASQDKLAQASVQRIDARRLDALTQVWTSMVTNETHARAAAMIPHLILIGASVVTPRLSEDELIDVFELLGTLASAVPGVQPAQRDGSV